MLRLRLRGPGGKTVTGSFDPTQAYGSFLLDCAARFGEEKVEMLSGFPPVVCTDDESSSLGSVVASGASLTFRRPETTAAATPTASSIPEPSNPTPFPPATPSSGASPVDQSMWQCEACTLLNNPTLSACAACETPRSQTHGSTPQSGSGEIPTTAIIEKMRDDNSCLFHGISWLLDTNTSPATMRQSIAAAVRNNPAQWCEATLGKSPQDYITFITDSTKWGGQVRVVQYKRILCHQVPGLSLILMFLLLRKVELCILAECYQAEVAVSDVQTGRIDVYGQGCGYTQRVYLLFTGIHFDAVSFEHVSLAFE